MELRKLLAFGTGIGIEIRGGDLEVVMARVRPAGVRVPGHLTIRRFRERPAAEWGAEYAAFLKQFGGGHLSATVLLPRRDVIVRQLALPGVADKDIEAAISFQLDSLHPYGEEPVDAGWVALGRGAVAVGIVRRATQEQYLELFAAAGIAVACFTFSASALHAAVRLIAPPPDGFVALSAADSGAVEVYGESPSRPVLSAEFRLPAERAAAMAAAELRLPADTEPLPVECVLPVPLANPVENDLARRPLPYATALAAACPRLVRMANLLPPDRRSASSRALFIPTAIAAGLLVVLAGASLAYSSLEDRRYLRKLQAEIARLEPQAKRATAIEREIDRTRARARLLHDFRGRTRNDLDALNELTTVLPPPTWTNLVELSRESANISGEAEQAAALLKLLDGSPLFKNSAFNVISRTGSNELFRIQAQREGHP